MANKPLREMTLRELWRERCEAALCWFAGWRWDADGWLVRARRDGDPDLNAADHSEIGFVEEACIAVRRCSDARVVDRHAALARRGVRLKAARNEGGRDDR